MIPLSSLASIVWFDLLCLHVWASRPEARLGYRPPEEYGDGGSKVGINRPSGRTGGREGIDGRSTLFMVGEKKLF